MSTYCYQTYNNSVIHSTTDKVQILLMLYDGAEKFINLARMGMEKNNPEIKGNYISKVIAILSELDIALDKEIGGEIAENLSSLYGYMIKRLTTANLKNDIGILDEVSRLVKELGGAFKEAAQKESRKTATQPEAEVSQGVRFAV